MDKGFFGDLFDFNGDDKLDTFERAMDFMAFDNMVNDTSDTFEEDDEEDELVCKLELEGLDYDELELMDEDERNEVLEDAGLDPVDYDFW